MKPVQQCSLSDYQRIAGRLPRPSDEQVENFVEFVCGAHSWYKHLPLLPPGALFYFFVEPFSGYDTVMRPGEKVVFEERTEQSQRFHYTWMTTKEYRLRFAFLSYDTTFMLESTGCSRDYSSLPSFSTTEGTFAIPNELAEAGSTGVTAIVHKLTPRVWVWDRFLPAMLGESDDVCRLPSMMARADGPRKWPSETGGEETLKKIREFCDQRSRWPKYRTGFVDPELELLLLPEKRRLQANMTQAIHRMLELAYKV